MLISAGGLGLSYAAIEVMGRISRSKSSATPVLSMIDTQSSELKCFKCILYSF